MYKRSEFHLIKERLEEPRRFVQVVMGPRQIGKSTVVKQVLRELNHPFQFYSADNVPVTGQVLDFQLLCSFLRSLKKSVQKSDGKN